MLWRIGWAAVARPTAACAGPHDGDAGRRSPRAGHAGGSVALVDVDDIRLGLAVGAGSADLFFLLGVSDAEAVGWIAQQVDTPGRAPAAIFVKDPSPAAVEAGSGARHGGGGRRTPRPLGAALQAGQPRVRAPRRSRRPAVRLRHRPVRVGPVDRRPHPRHDQHRGRPIPCAGVLGVQRRGRRVAPADDPRPRRAARAPGVDRPVGHLRRTAGQWRGRPRRRAPELGLRPRLAVGIHLPATDARRPPGFAGTIWLQQGSAPLADDVEEVLRGGAVLAARIMSRLAAAPSTHTVQVQDLLGLRGGRRRRRCHRPRTGHQRRRPCGVGRVPRRGYGGAGQRDRVERERFSRRRAGGVNRRTRVRAAAEDRRDVVADVVGARHGRRAAPRTRPDIARGDRRPAGRARRRGGRPRRGGPRVRQRRTPPGRHRSGHVARRSAHDRAARRDRLARRRSPAARRPARARAARAGSDAGRHAVRVSGRVR